MGTVRSLPLFVVVILPWTKPRRIFTTLRAMSSHLAGDLLLSDNASVKRAVVADIGPGERSLHRVTLDQQPPVFPPHGRGAIAGRTRQLSARKPRPDPRSRSADHTALGSTFRIAGLEPVGPPSRSPNRNAGSERLSGSMQSECVSQAIPFGKRHLRLGGLPRGRFRSGEAGFGFLNDRRDASEMTTRPRGRKLVESGVAAGLRPVVESFAE